MEKWRGSSTGYPPDDDGTTLRNVRRRSSLLGTRVSEVTVRRIETDVAHPSPVTFEHKKMGHALDVTKLDASSHAIPTSLTFRRKWLFQSSVHEMV